MIVSNLPDVVLSNCMAFVGEGNYLFVAGVCRSFRDIYTSYLQQHHDEQKQTSTKLKEIVSSVPRLQMVMKALNIDIDNIARDRRGTALFEPSSQHGGACCCSPSCLTAKMLWRGISVGFWRAAIGCASYHGNLDVLVWIKKSNQQEWKRCDLSSLSKCNEAVKGGQLQVLQWLRSAEGGNCSWTVDTCRIAAEKGHLEIVQWASQNGCPWDELTCYYAAQNGHLEILKWAHQHGCHWDECTCSGATIDGHFEMHYDIFELAKLHGCPRDEDDY